MQKRSKDTEARRATVARRTKETAIAATIVYVAIENIRGAPTRHRWLLTFFFGLIHGFGFANVLGEMGLPTTGLVRCLLSFNVGVELGQRRRRTKFTASVELEHVPAILRFM